MDTLEILRRQIDMLDAQLIEVLGRRFDVCQQVALYKKEQGIPMMQPGRIEIVKERCRNLGLQKRVDPDFISGLYDLIIREGCRLEDAIIEGGKT